MPERAVPTRNPRMPQVDVETLSGEETMEVPIAKAGASFAVAMMTGTFHGVMAATTPRGSRKV